MQESASPLAITLPAEAGMVCKIVGMEPHPINTVARDFCSEALGDEEQAFGELYDLRNLKGDGGGHPFRLLVSINLYKTLTKPLTLLTRRPRRTYILRGCHSRAGFRES